MSAIAFLTVLGRSRPPGAQTLRWFPVVGALVGAGVAGAHQGAHQLWAPLVAGAVVIAVDLALTGALHLDGLADTADGLLPHMERRRRLAIMAEPDVGAFAIAVVVTILILRWALLADPDIDAVAVIALWATSRTLAALAPALLPYARPGGLASPFLGGSYALLTLSLAPAAVLLAVWSGPRGAVAFGVAVTTAAAVGALAHRRLGGFTGDVLGAIILVAETSGLLALAAQP